MGIAKRIGRRRQRVCEILKGILTDSTLSRGRRRSFIHPHKHSRTCAYADGGGQEKTRRKKACRFCGSARRPHGCTDNCQKYGRCAYVTNVIYRVIMGAINSSSLVATACCLQRFKEYPVKCETLYYNVHYNLWDQK